MVQDEDVQPAQVSNRTKILDTVAANPNAYSRWTDNENRELLDLVQSGIDWPALSDRLGRTPSAIRTQARRLAFEQVHSRSIPDRQQVDDRHGQPWTVEELLQLPDLIATASSWEEIGQALQRDPATCRRRAENDALRSITPD